MKSSLSSQISLVGKIAVEEYLAPIFTLLFTSV